MGIYRRKNKEGKYHGPWNIKYPQKVDPATGKTIYASHKVSFSKKVAELAFAKKMLEWQKQKHLGLEKRKRLEGQVLQ